jgi:hypothetical protein
VQEGGGSSLEDRGEDGGLGGLLGSDSVAAPEFDPSAAADAGMIATPYPGQSILTDTE